MNTPQSAAGDRSFEHAPGKLEWCAVMTTPVGGVDDTDLRDWFDDIHEVFAGGFERGLMAPEESNVQLPEPSTITFRDGSLLLVGTLGGFVTMGARGFREIDTHPAESLAIAFSWRHPPPWEWHLCCLEGHWPVEH